MTNDEMKFWLEIGKLAASLATPIVVAILGILLLRRIEGVKAAVATRSEFHKKWAEQFFGCCQEFLQSLEREMALLIVLAGSKSPNDQIGIELQREIGRLNHNILELKLRIARNVVFAPSTGGAVVKAANECYDLVAALLASKKGNPAEITGKMNEFNVASRKAHAEMLGVRDHRMRQPDRGGSNVGSLGRVGGLEEEQKK